MLVYAPLRDRANEHGGVAHCVDAAKARVERPSLLSMRSPDTINRLDDAAHAAVIAWLANVTGNANGTVLHAFS